MKFNIVLIICSFAATNLMADAGTLEATVVNFRGEGTTEVAALKNAEIKSKSFNKNGFYLESKYVTYQQDGGTVYVQLNYCKRRDNN